MIKLSGYKNLVEAVQGAFWVIYEGVNARTQARLWLQVFDESIAEDETFRRHVAALIAETCRLEHPNVLAPLTLEVINGRQVVLYSPFHGQSVFDLINSGVPIVERRAAAAMRQAAAALQFARIRGYHHGLFNSEFLLLSRTSEDAKIMGFGFDRLYYALRERHYAGAIRYAAYLPPDKFASQQPTPDDAYALGLIGYEMLTGKLVFEGETLADIRRNKLMPLPAPRQLNPKLSQQISNLTMELIDPNQARRANYNAVLDVLAPQVVHSAELETDAKESSFDLKSLKRAASKMSLPDNLVGSKKRMVNVLFSVAVLFIVLISLSLISYASKSNSKRFQAVYEEFLTEDRHTAEPSPAAAIEPPPLPAENFDHVAKPVIAAEPEQKMVEPKTVKPAVKEEQPQHASAVVRTLTIERPPFADQVRVGGQTLPLPAQVSLPIGSHSATFIDGRSGFNWQTNFELQENSPATLVIDPAQVGSGEILIVLKNANDFGYVFVTIDDTAEQHATPFRTLLYAGRHRLRMYRENLTVSPADTVVFVVPNDKATIQVTAY